MYKQLIEACLTINPKENTDDLYDMVEYLGCHYGLDLEYSVSYDSEEDESRVVGLEIHRASWGATEIDLYDNKISEAKDKLSKIFTEDLIKTYLVSSYF